MINYGFVKVAAAVPGIRVADTDYNTDKIISAIKEASKTGVEIIVFPELSLTSATCGDLFTKRYLIECAEKSLSTIISECKEYSPLVILGMPVAHRCSIYNSAVIFQGGKILCVVPKTHLSKEESRWFSSGRCIKCDLDDFCGQQTHISDNYVCKSGDTYVTVKIGSDAIYNDNRLGNSADIVAVPAAYREVIGSYKNILTSLTAKSKTEHVGYVFSSAGYGESSTDFVYSGASLIIENGKVLAEGERFVRKDSIIISDIDTQILVHDRAKDEFLPKLDFDSAKCLIGEFSMSLKNETKLTRSVDAHPFIPDDKDMLSERCKEVFEIQTTALIQRLRHTGCTKAVIGISGGLDSTLSLLVTVEAFDKINLDRKNITGITMPGFGTTDRTYKNSVEMIRLLGISFKEISIKDACIQHFKDIGHSVEQHDTTYENAQARERTQILMDIANKTGALHIGTGDLSELALGWATYNGDHMSMYDVNGGVPKTLARYMVAWFAMQQNDIVRSILVDIVNTPISPELIPADSDGKIRQKTEDLVGPYELHDFFLFNFMRYGFSPEKIFFLAKEGFGDKYDSSTIKHWLTVFFKRFFSQQFKRSCLSDGPAIGSVGVSPRGGLVMPSDASAEMWVKRCQNL